MPQQETIPKGYHFGEKSDGDFEAQTDHHGTRFSFGFKAVRPNVFRTAFYSSSHPLPPYPSAREPVLDLSSVKVIQDNRSTTSRSISVGDVVVNLSLDGPPVLTIKFADQEAPLYQDLPFRSYAVDGPGIAHYTTYDRPALHVGLGEKSAPMDLTGRQFKITATDSFGYDVYRTDPLYKHIPLLITATPAGVVAQFSTSHARGSWSVGSEMDGLWGRYKVYRQDYGGLEEYIVVGRTLQEVVKTYADIVGYPLLVPRWSFGYIAGGYKYAMLDEPKASDALMDFADKLKKHDIPCSAMQLSSGYHVAHEEPKVRNVFCWNKFRFPDPEAWLKSYRDVGLKVIANVKPFLLESHPDFQKLLKADAFFKDPETGRAGFMRLWSAGGGESGEGCHLDFTSQAARDWWYNGVKNLAREGVAVPWNDNNEYVLPNDNWTLKMDSSDVDVTYAKSLQSRLPGMNQLGLWGRAMHTELMGKASHDALVDFAPERRPFVLTRSATAGTMRYACSSWSGDNQTSWDGMKGANAISLNAGMSLLQCFGHDIGGFEGPQPTPELLVRWVQVGAYSPRFAINCFKTSPDNNSVGEVIEPWMYPEATPLVRAAIKRRYEILPYLYSLSLESHMTAMPPQRWTGWGFESDPEVWSSQLLREGETQYWLGDTLLIGGVFESGVATARMYLPRKAGLTGAGYLNIHSPYQYMSDGSWVDIEAQWDASIPVVARVGGVVPIGKSVQTKSTGDNTEPADMAKDDYRGVEIFPLPASMGESPKFSNRWFEDDGIAANPAISTMLLEYHSDSAKVYVNFTPDSRTGYHPEWKSLDIILPHGDQREVVASGSCKVHGTQIKSDGRVGFEISL